MKAERTGSTVAVYHLHDDASFLAASIAALEGRVPVLAFVSRVPWSGEPGDWQATAKIAAEAGAEVIEGEWAPEDVHKIAAIKELKARGYSHAITIDGDEIIEPRLLDHLLKIAESGLADRVYIEWDTYWKSVEHVVRPREPFRPCILIDLDNAEHVHIRDFKGGRPLLLGEEYGIIHHLSYVGSDARIKRKITSWSHKDEIVPGWWQNVWKAWDSDRTLRNLHPTHPDAYRFVERIEVPAVLARVMGGDTSPASPNALPLAVPAKWPQVSVVIPVHCGAELLRSCLSSLDKCKDLLHEVVVVDNASADGCLQVCEEFDFVKTIENDENLGFSKACNQGYEDSTGDIALFLNSDTIVPRSGLIRLIEPLISGGTVAASGPLTNNCSHLQKIEPTYTDRSRIGLFADDFATIEKEPLEVDMLVGFCLAVKRTALEDVGVFDERFGIGTWEDNDLCYRLRRSGWRLVIAQNAFVHHEGSVTLRKVAPDTDGLLRENELKYREKWKADIDSGFASHLAGTSAERIRFTDELKPDLRMKEIDRKRDAANISLCMIVKDEERVLAKCLESARPFLKKMIVVDTGSSDRTVEIAESLGAEVRHMEWPDSFAVARNESLRGAKGEWIFWLDADDTLPHECGEAILEAALTAPDDVLGFVVPVQFVDDGPGGGTRVDHVKLFRNLPGLAFEGRIHEQILGKLRQHEGKIARCGAHVLHSGYDTSEEGQRKKRERDEVLLKLDLEDRPGHPFVLFNLGMTAHYTDGHEEALEWLDQCIAASGPNDSHVRKAYAMKAVSHRELGDNEMAIKVLQEGLDTVGDDAELHFHMGLILSNLERYEESLEHYHKVKQADPSGYFTSMDVGILGFKLCHNMASVLNSLGRYDEAKAELMAALKEAPQYMPSAFELFDQALERKDFAAAQEAIAHVRQHDGENKSWAEMTLKFAGAVGGGANIESTMAPVAERNVHARRALSSWYVKDGRPEKGARYWNSLQEHGDAESAYMLGVREMRKGQYRQALRWMRRAHELNPDHQETAQQIAGLENALSQEQ